MLTRPRAIPNMAAQRFARKERELFYAEAKSEASMRRLVHFLCSCLVLAGIASAQDITGSITGTVKDNSGAVISGANVTLTNSDTNVVARKVTTDEGGSYLAPVLPVGRYNITVE